MLEELIKVEKSTIGGEEVNSVNTRDVYNYINHNNDYPLYSLWLAEFNVEELMIPSLENAISEDDAKSLIMMGSSLNCNNYRKYMISVDTKTDKEWFEILKGVKSL